MNDKEKRFIEAAIEVLSRYGVRRTTMGDIAEQAGVSRQTLYASYANKDEILAAAMHYLVDKTVEGIKADWEVADTIDEKLDAYFQHAVIAYYEGIKNMPDSVDLISGIDATTNAELEKGDKIKKAALAKLFAAHEDSLKSAGTSSADLADLVQSSSSNFKFIARDEDHLKRLLASLKSAALSLLGER